MTFRVRENGVDLDVRCDMLKQSVGADIVGDEIVLNHRGIVTEVSDEVAPLPGDSGEGLWSVQVLIAAVTQRGHIAWEKRVAVPAGACVRRILGLTTSTQNGAFARPEFRRRLGNRVRSLRIF